MCLLSAVFALERLKVEARWGCRGKETQRANGVNWERKAELWNLLWLQFPKLQE